MRSYTCRAGDPNLQEGGVHSPAVCEEAAADVPGAVAPWSGTGHALRLHRLPGELGAIEVPVLLPLGRQGAAGGAAVGGVLPGDVALAVAAGNGAPGSRQRDMLSCLASPRWWPHSTPLSGTT